MAKKPVPAKKPSKPAPGKPAAKANPGKSKPAAPAKKPAPLAKKPAAKPTPKAVAKPVAKPAVKAVAKPAPKPAAKEIAKPVAKPAPKPVAAPAPAPAPVPSRPSLEKSSDVDPLLAGGNPPLKLVGGLSRDAQLPTTLVPKLELPAAVPLTVHAQAVPHTAHPGNNHAANILVLVTCGGWPVVDLNTDHFSIMEHFDVPGQSAPFSNNIVSFRNSGSGAYLIQVRPIGGAPWAGGQHLAQILVSSPDERHGQSAVKLIIR